MDKTTIRQSYLQKRMELNTAAIEAATGQILRNFQQMQFRPITNILSYYPLVARNEFNVSVCGLHLLNLFPSLQIYWPRINAADFSMNAHLKTIETRLKTNRYGIVEPVDGPTIQPVLIDLVFVPLVAFDKRGYRVGYGKGYYDRFLIHCKSDVMTIGFSFFEALDQIDGLDEFDVPLKICISPTCIYEF